MRGGVRARARARDRDSERERGRGRKDQWAVRGPGRANCRVSEGGTVEGRKEDSVRERERERGGVGGRENVAKRGEPLRNGLLSRARACAFVHPRRLTPPLIAHQQTVRISCFAEGSVRAGCPDVSRVRFCSFEESAEKFVGRAVEKRVIATASRESSRYIQYSRVEIWTER
jgi:hypothetical protein